MNPRETRANRKRHGLKPDSDPTVAAYERHADLFEARASQAVQRMPPLLARTLASLPPGSRVLDLGCGSGHDALSFLAAGHHVHGVDATGVFVERAAARCARWRKAARFEVADLKTWAPPRGRYDLAWANASLIHVPKSHLPAVLKRLRAGLAPGGRFVATIHNGRREGLHPGTWIPGRFFASYLKDELGAIVEAVGFGAVAVTGVVNEDRKGRWLNLSATRD